MIVLFIESKTPIGVWCKQRLNSKFLIQLLEILLFFFLGEDKILLIELTGNHHFIYLLFNSFWGAQKIIHLDIIFITYLFI